MTGWRLDNASAVPRACPGSGCTGDPHQPCTAGLTGKYCLSCVNYDDQYYSASDSACLPCSSATLLGPLLVLVLFLLLLLLLLFLIGNRLKRERGALVAAPTADVELIKFGPDDMPASIDMQPLASLTDQGGDAAGSPPRRVMANLSYSRLARMTRFLHVQWVMRMTTALWNAVRPLLPSLLTKLKIVWSFYQIVTLVPRVYKVSLPAPIRALLASFEAIVRINLSGISTRLQCIGLRGFQPELAFWFATPLVAMALAPLVGLWLALGDRASRGGSGADRADAPPTLPLMTATLYRSLPLIQQISFLSFPSVCTMAFSAFDCETFSDGSAAQKSYYVQVSDGCEKVGRSVARPRAHQGTWPSLTLLPTVCDARGRR